MPRLFISHSSRDNLEALAFKRWLTDAGWGEDEVFIDLHGIGAGEEWQKVLVRANIACDALLFLASPDSLASDECRREVRRAEDDRKDVIVAMMKGITLADERLRPYASRQIVDLSTAPRAERIEVEHGGIAHMVDFNPAALASINTTLIERGHAPDSFPWPPKDRPSARPYPGLEALDEESAAIFFGREADVMTGIREMRRLRERGSPRLMVIQAASGAGKSSFLRAGLWRRLSRTAEFAPLAIVRPAKGIITGPQHGLSKGMERWFGQHRQTRSAGSIQAELMAGDATGGSGRLATLLGEAAALAAEARGIVAAMSALVSGAATPARQSIVLAIDQGEELFAVEDKAENDRFLAMLGTLLAAPPAGLDPYVLITIRADSVDALLRRIPDLGIESPFVLPLPPLSPAAYRDVITRPAAVHARRVAPLTVEADLVQALVDETRGADALPLLAFTLQRLFDAHAADRRLTLAQFTGMGGIGGSIDRALAEALSKAGAVGTHVNLRRLIVPGLATWDPAVNAAKRLVPREADLLRGDRASLAPLANTLVEARLLTRGAGTIEVAHEALLRRKPIDDWLAEQKDALALRDNVLKEARDWANDKVYRDKRVLLLRSGERLRNALTLAVVPDYSGSLAPASNYLRACLRHERSVRRRTFWTHAGIYTLLLAVIGGMAARMYERELNGLWFQYARVRPHLVMADAALALPRGQPFWDCATTDAHYSRLCPGMVVVPAGEFTMGSPDEEMNRHQNEGPQRKVTFKAPLAVAAHEVTFDQWDQCVGAGGCKTLVSDSGWSRGRRPVINVNWHDAREYVAWMSHMTGHTYRLLTEAEWEYAARAGNQARWSFGDDEKHLAEHAWFSSNSGIETQPVGSKKPNPFGLYDMHGNVNEWVQDCFVASYKDAPSDGSAVSKEVGCRRVVRGGSWSSLPRDLRSADRGGDEPINRNDYVGFRVARVFP